MYYFLCVCTLPLKINDFHSEMICFPCFFVHSLCALCVQCIPKTVLGYPKILMVQKIIANFQIGVRAHT